MAAIASKNPYELLDLEPSQPQAVSAPKAKAPAAGKSKQAQKAPLSANEQAFRDRKVGAQANQSRETKPDEEGRRNRGRGPRGGRTGGRPPRSDRQDRTGRDETEKAVGNAWGQADGEHKLEDEQAAEKIAKKDAESGDFAPESSEEKEEEPAQVSYSAWLEKQSAEKASAGLGALAPREVSSNISGTKIESKKSQDVSDAAAPTASRSRQNGRRKVVLDVDTRPAEAPRTNRSEGRGGAPRGRGGPRGGRSSNNNNGRSENRGRGGRDQAGPNLGDADAFPRLGA